MNKKYIMRTLKLLPPRPDVCQQCAVEHDPDEPHDLESLYYGMQFKMATGPFREVDLGNGG